MENKSSNGALDQTLGPIMLWGLGVGYVISGMYFGWNLGLPEGGTLGLAVATLFITIMYVTFTFSYTELACAIPKAGGAFSYSDPSSWEKLGLCWRNGPACRVCFCSTSNSLCYWCVFQ